MSVETIDTSPAFIRAATAENDRFFADVCYTRKWNPTERHVLVVPARDYDALRSWALEAEELLRLARGLLLMYQGDNDDGPAVNECLYGIDEILEEEDDD